MKIKFASKKMILLVVIFLLFSLSPTFSTTVNISQEIDFGVNIFTKNVSNLKIDDLESLTLNLDKYDSYPVHSFLIRNYINKIVEGTRNISDVKKDLLKLYEEMVIRTSSKNVITVFDRSFVAIFIATYNYSEFPPRLYALSALSDMSLLLTEHPANPWFHLFYTIEYASLASINNIDISDYKTFDPLIELRKALSVDSKDSWFHYVVAETFLALSGYSEDIHKLAYSEFTIAEKLAPENPMLQKAIHKVYFKLLNEYNDKKMKKPFWLENSVYSYILKTDPRNPAAMNNLGFLYAKYNVNLTKAVELTKTAVELVPDNDSFLDSYGYALLKSGKITKGVKILEKAYKINQNDKDLNTHLCEIYLSLNQNEKAIPLLYWLQKRDPKNDVINNNLAYTLAEINRDLNLALKYINSALEISPNSAIYLDTKGWIFVKMGMIENGFSLINKAVSINPRLGALYIHRGDIYFINGDIEKAEREYMTALKFEPDFPGVLDNLARITAIKTLKNLILKKNKKFKYTKYIKTPFDYGQYIFVLEKLEEEISK